jgi:hypothetical protein
LIPLWQPKRPFAMMAERAMAPKQLLPLIQQLKDWRKQNGLSQYEASRVLREAGIPVTTDSLQAWEIARWNPRAPVAWRWPNSSKSSPNVDTANGPKNEVSDRSVRGGKRDFFSRSIAHPCRL